MSSERGSLAEVVRQEFADRLAASEEENRRVKAELAELQARQQLELEEVHRRWVARAKGRAACSTPTSTKAEAPQMRRASKVKASGLRMQAACGQGWHRVQVCVQEAWPVPQWH